MKILIIVPTLYRGGAERVVSRLSQEWAQLHSVSIALFDISDIAYRYGGNLIDIGLPAEDKGMLRKISNTVARAIRLYRTICNNPPDHIISFMESANFPAILAAGLAGRLTALSVSVRTNPAYFTRGHRWPALLLYCWPAKVVAVSCGVMSELEKMGVPKNKLTFIPNPAPALSTKTPKMNKSLPKLFLLAVGRLNRVKGFDYLLRAFAKLDDPTIQLVILGEGDERVALEHLAEELNITSRVLMPGNVDDPMPWYNAAICLALSSRYEGWPNVIMEAMVNGCPVVAFDCQYGPSEIIEDGVSGLLVKMGDIEELKCAVERLICDETLRRSLAEQGLRRAAEFDIRQIAQRWL